MTDHLHLHDRLRKPTGRLALALSITLIFVIFEALAAFYANSLALLTDAAHNLTDVIALGLSWFALYLATRPAHAKKTFGYHRAGILVALINSTTLIIISLGIFYEAYLRLTHLPDVRAGILAGTSAIAFLVNAGTAWLVSSGSKNDLNMHSAFIHLAADAVSTLGAFIAGLLIIFTGWKILDPLVSVLIGGLILWNAWGILRETISILLEGVPVGLDLDIVVSDLLQVEGVRGIHDLHIWSINKNMRLLSAHILVDDIPISETMIIQDRIDDLLTKRYGIAHTTMQFECTDCEPPILYCDLSEINHDYE